MTSILEQVTAAFQRDDTAAVGEMLAQHPELRARINEPVGGFGSPPLLCAKSCEMVDVLLAAGADINVKSVWWAGGFGLLHTADAALTTHAIARGATIDVHAAARLGMLEELKRLLAANPALVHARGGDGQTPLHFASTVEIAAALLDHGADIDARDVDHESTPAQYMVRDRQAIARDLIRRGCQTDILMAAALGDLDLVRRHLERDPNAVRMRVSDEYFPMIGGRAGGTIYQWMLGWHVSAHQVAKAFGHEDAYALLLTHSSPELKLTTAGWLGDEPAMRALLDADPGLPARLDAVERRQLAHAARNNNLIAVRLLAKAGLPVDAKSQHGATPLHWAAFHGNTEMVEVLLQRSPSLTAIDSDFQGTPLGWAIYGSEHGWNPSAGDYVGTVTKLLGAGAPFPARLSGTPAVRRVLDGWPK